MHEDLERLVVALFPELRSRAPRAATMLMRLIDGEPVGRLVAEAIRSSAPTLPPAADDTPTPVTLPTGAMGAPGQRPKGTP